MVSYVEGFLGPPLGCPSLGSIHPWDSYSLYVLLHHIHSITSYHICTNHHGVYRKCCREFYSARALVVFPYAEVHWC